MLMTCKLLSKVELEIEGEKDSGALAHIYWWRCQPQSGLMNGGFPAVFLPIPGWPLWSGNVPNKGAGLQMKSRVGLRQCLLSKPCWMTLVTFFLAPPPHPGNFLMWRLRHEIFSLQALQFFIKRFAMESVSGPESPAWEMWRDAFGRLKCRIWSDSSPGTCKSVDVSGDQIFGICRTAGFLMCLLSHYVSPVCRGKGGVALEWSQEWGQNSSVSSNKCWCSRVAL